MKGKRARKKIAELKRRPMRQDSGTKEDLKALALSWLDRPVHDIIVCPSLIVVDGHRRLEGLELLGETEADVFVTDEELDHNQILQIGLTTAIHRADLGGYDKWQACVKLLELNPSWDQKTLADTLKHSAARVTHLLSPSKLIQDWQDALREGKVSISDCYAASKRAPEEQLGLLAFKLSGASRDDLERAGLKSRNRSEVPVARASKIKVPLVSGATVTIASEAVSMEDALEATLEAAKQIKAAIAKGIQAKSAQAYWRDIAAAG